MKTSIATVCLSGGLTRSSRPLPPPDSRGSRSSRTTAVLDGTPADVRRRDRRSRAEIITFQPFRDFEGMPLDSRDRIFARAERKFDLMGELGCDLLLVCSNVSPESLGGIDRAAADLLGTRRARGQARTCESASRRWPGGVTSTTTATPGRRCAAPTIRRSGLVLDTFHIYRPQDRSQADRRHSARPHLPGPAGGRAAPRHGSCHVEPAFPQFPRPRGIAAARFHGGAGRRPARRHALARNLQRPVPRRLRPQRRGGWPALATCSCSTSCASAPASRAGTRSSCRRVRGAAAPNSSSSPSTRARRAGFETAARARIRAPGRATSRKR